MIVYKVVNTITGKAYIGQTRYSLPHRWSAHCRLKSHCTALAGAIHKYGREAFKKEVLVTHSCPVVITYHERKFIKELDTLAPNGYNLTTGGEHARHTEVSKKKLSVSKLGSKNPMYGKKLSEEHRAKIAASLLGRKRPESVKAQIKANHNPKSDKNLTYRRKSTT